MQLSRSRAVLGVLCLNVALAATACSDGLNARPSLDAGFSSDARPADAPGVDAAPEIDAPTGPDAPLPTNLIIQVANTGNDLNDGFVASVATLQRAIAIAGANPRVIGIAFAAGRYAAERFPYTVPDNLTLSGPAGGGAVLVGPRNLPGLLIAKGTVRDLEFEDFTVAITASSEVRLENLRVRTSETAVAAKDAARLIVDNLDVSGVGAPPCATGIDLTGTADLVATNFVTHALGFAVYADDETTARITGGTFQGDPGCGIGAILEVLTSKTIELRDSSLTGGSVGIELDGDAEVTIANATVSGMGNGLLGRPLTLQMIGGELSGNSANAAFATAGTWTFTGVMITNNGDGVSVGALNMGQPARLTMRECQLIDNKEKSIEVQHFATADLGTLASPGNNTVRSANVAPGQAQPVALTLSGDGGSQIDAVGNHWNRSVQGANDAGDYPEAAIIQGPLGGRKGETNFKLDAGWSLQR